MMPIYDTSFRSHEERKKTRILRSRQQSIELLAATSEQQSNDDIHGSSSTTTTTAMEDDDTGGEDNRGTAAAADADDDDALCPICLCEMEVMMTSAGGGGGQVEEEGVEQLTRCSSCHNSLHHSCMAIWTAECQSQGEAVVCPLCRSVWSPVVVPGWAVGCATGRATTPQRPLCENQPHNQQNINNYNSSAYQYFAPSPYTAPGGGGGGAAAKGSLASSAAGRTTAAAAAHNYSRSV
jgi:uncharacterized CHY-type Zn-finger protein